MCKHDGLRLRAEPANGRALAPAGSAAAIAVRQRVPEHGHLYQVLAKPLQLELYLPPQADMVAAVPHHAAPVAEHDGSGAPRPVAVPKARARIDHHDGHHRRVEPRADLAVQRRRDGRLAGQIVPEHLDVASVLQVLPARQQGQRARRRGRHRPARHCQELVPCGLVSLGHVRLFPDEGKAPLARAALGRREIGASARDDQLVPRRAERQDARPAHVVLALDEPDRVLVAPLQRKERALKVLRPLPLAPVGHRYVGPLLGAVGDDHDVARHRVDTLLGHRVKVAPLYAEVFLDCLAHRARGSGPLGIVAGKPAGLEQHVIHRVDGLFAQGVDGVGLLAVDDAVVGLAAAEGPPLHGLEERLLQNLGDLLCVVRTGQPHEHLPAGKEIRARRGGRHGGITLGRSPRRSLCLAQRQRRDWRGRAGGGARGEHALLSTAGIIHRHANLCAGAAWPQRGKRAVADFGRDGATAELFCARRAARGPP